MERRLFLAIGLSLVIVWLWSSVAPRPHPRPTTPEILQHIDNKEDTNKPKIFDGASSVSGLSSETSADEAKAVEKKTSLDSAKISAEFSNIGATLNKIVLTEYDASFPLRGITSISGYESIPFVLDKADGNAVSYSYETNALKVIKTFVINDGDYIIESGIEFINKTDMSKLVDLRISSYTIEMSSLDKKINDGSEINNRDKSLQEYVIYDENAMYRKAGAFKFSQRAKKQEFGKILWSGFRNRYFCFLNKPLYDTSGYTVDPVDVNNLRVDVVSKGITIPPQGSVHFDSVLYAGPEKLELLKEYGFGFEKIKRYYRFALFDGTAKIIDSLMHLIHRVIPNWGACIILISLTIYFSMYPLTIRGMLSMKRMQALQPIIVKLKAKHKDNPQKINKEMMELYREHKVNPLGGCLPMLLQMPVFIGLYQVLWRSVSFKGAHFLWIKDLSQPDRLFIFPSNLPFFGNEFNLLPLIMVVVMFFQQKLSTKNMVVTDPSQATQQKMMGTIMPLFLGFIFYKFASGLTLYFTMFYFLSTFTQWKMSKIERMA